MRNIVRFCIIVSSYVDSHWLYYSYYTYLVESSLLIGLNLISWEIYEACWLASDDSLNFYTATLVLRSFHFQFTDVVRYYQLMLSRDGFTARSKLQPHAYFALGLFYTLYLTLRNMCKQLSHVFNHVYVVYVRTNNRCVSKKLTHPSPSVCYLQLVATLID